MSIRNARIRQMTEKYGFKTVERMNKEDCANAISILSDEIAALDHRIFDYEQPEDIGISLMDQRCDYAQLRSKVRDRLTELKLKERDLPPYRMYVTTYRLISPVVDVNDECNNAIRDALALY